MVHILPSKVILFDSRSFPINKQQSKVSDHPQPPSHSPHTLGHFVKEVCEPILPQKCDKVLIVSDNQELEVLLVLTPLPAQWEVIHARSHSTHARSHSTRARSHSTHARFHFNQLHHTQHSLHPISMHNKSVLPCVFKPKVPFHSTTSYSHA